MAYYDKDVEKLLGEGLTYALIGEKLGITEKMVNHAQQRLKKEVEGEEERLPEVEKRDGYYLVRSRKREIIISEEKLKLLKDLYCGQRMTINEVCRKIDLPRPHFMVIKNAFTIVKDDPPFTDDEFTDSNIDDLVDTTLEKKKDQYFIKLQQKEIEAMRRELHAYRQQDYFISKIHKAVTQHMTEFERTYTGPKIEPRNPEGRSTMLEVAICDLHFGKLCWYPETGSNFDYKIARKLYMEVIDDIYERAKDRNIEKILFIVGSDFFHYDTIQVTTTAGTPQDSDLRWHKLYAIGTQMLVESIDKLATLAPVEVLGIPGNHDKQTVFYAKHYLAGRYIDSDRVTVSDNLKTRTYIEYGKNLIGFSHGDKEGSRIFELMHVEAPAAWARTKFREFHLGHFHSEKANEKSGIVARNLSSITGTDAWHFEKGYTTAARKCQSFLWDKERGLSEVWHTNLD